MCNHQNVVFHLFSPSAATMENVFFLKRCSQKFRKIQPATLFKKRLCHRCFPADFAKFLKTTFLQNTTARQLLYGPCIIFTTQGAIDGFLINRYLARLMAFPQYSSFKQEKLQQLTQFVDRTYCESFKFINSLELKAEFIMSYEGKSVLCLFI